MNTQQKRTCLSIKYMYKELYSHFIHKQEATQVSIHSSMDF